MGPSLLLLFNHVPTGLQLMQARAELGVERIIPLPVEIKPLWDSVPPELEGIQGHLFPIRAWVENSSRPGDFILIQGDFGAAFLMVRFASERGLVPIYSTTRREAIEQHEPDGTVVLTHRFQHVRFRRYGE